MPLILLTLLACHKDKSTPFPDGLEPLAENTASWPDANSEDLSLTSGMDEDDTGDYYWTHARGYVQADFATVFECLSTPDVVVDRRAASDWDVTWDVEEGYDVSFRVHNVVPDIVTVEFDVTWRLGEALAEDGETPKGAGRWQKTDGTTYITRLEGSLEVEVYDEDTTGLSYVEILDAMIESNDIPEVYLSDLHSSIAACSRGDALPTYEEE